MVNTQRFDGLFAGMSESNAVELLNLSSGVLDNRGV